MRAGLRDRRVEVIIRGIHKLHNSLHNFTRNLSYEIWTVLHQIKQECNILHRIKRRKANWIGLILHRDSLLKHIIEGKTEGTERRGRISKQLLADLKKTKRSCKWREKALDHPLWRTRFGRGYGMVVRYSTRLLLLLVVVVVVVVVVVYKIYKYGLVPHKPSWWTTGWMHQ